MQSADPSPEHTIESKRAAAGLERWGFALALLLIVATVALYHPVSHYPFITFDDRDYVVHNYQIQSGLDWYTVRWAFTTFDASNWHPLTWLSHALDYQLFQLNPAGHHGTNVVLHALDAALLFWVLWRATGCAGRSFMVAALFALHPINVESVAWVSERKNVLSLFFMLLALGTYRWYAMKPRVDRYLAVALLYILGLMAKPQVITFPCLLLLWDYWPLQRMFAPAEDPAGAALSREVPGRGFGWLLLEKVPLLLLSAASAVLTMKAQRASGALNGTFTTYAFPIRLENAIVSYVRYIAKALWPSNLAILYPHPEGLLSPWGVAGAAVLLLAITVLVIAGRRRRYLLVGWFWFLGTLVPMIGLVQAGAQSMADRYAYVSFIGLFLIICWGVADVVQPGVRATESSRREHRHFPTALLLALSVVVLLALAAVARHQLSYWRDSVALWEHAVQVTRGNWMAEDFLGGLMLERGKQDEALAHYYRAVAINPADPVSNINLGNWNQYAGRPRAAIEYYQRVLQSPRAPEVLKAKAAEGIERTERDLGIGEASEVAPKQ